MKQSKVESIREEVMKDMEHNVNRTVLTKLLKEDKEMKKLVKELSGLHDKKYTITSTMTTKISVWHGVEETDIDVDTYDAEHSLGLALRKSEEYLNDRKRVKELVTSAVTIAKDTAKREKIKLTVAEIKELVLYVLV
jgi:hypothetical protein